jgi:DNA helicase HerA-like ATPase
MLNFDDLLQTDARGRGVINILAADKLMSAPRLYATFLLWMLSELFERLPEVGDLDKPQDGVLLRRGAPVVRRRSAVPWSRRSSRSCG